MSGVGAPATDAARPGTARSGTAAGPPAPGRGEIPLVDHAGLVLRAGRTGPVLPHMGWIMRFDEPVGREELEAEARRLAADPYGLGRRVLPRRLPGGRPRWVVSPGPPPVLLADEPVEGEALAAWIDARLATPLDPERGHGWLVAATPTAAGGTVVLVLMHHLFGTVAGVLRRAWPDGRTAPAHGTTETRLDAASTYTLRAEVEGIAERLTLGVAGAARAAVDGVRAARVGRTPAPATDPPALVAPKGVDRTRHGPGPERRAALASVDEAAWDAAAARRGGTGNTLLAAVTANLVRRGRRARGGDVGRPVRLVLPIDLGEAAIGFATDGSSGPRATMVTASVVLPGGDPVHGGLTVARRWMKAAFVADAQSAPPVRGVGDATRLLPEALTVKAAARAAMAFDACATNPGALPDDAGRLGPHVATDTCAVGFPIGLDLIVALSRRPGAVTICAVADAARLGGDPDLRGWVADELAAWGLPDEVW